MRPSAAIEGQRARLTEIKVEAQHVAIMTRPLQPLWTFNDVVDALGGPVAVGRITGQTCAAVCNWRRYRGLFPSKYYFCMRAALADEGYFAPISLWGFYGTTENNNAQAA
ncbi:hypothetical protein [Bradyrhizobium septentrionale]|uniref:Uncharacterized protein n=1 Tax=Bradyrhizobium septentrionale TaxID=1404411 RepID=A0ABZ2P9E7_9BRAD